VSRRRRECKGTCPWPQQWDFTKHNGVTGVSMGDVTNNWIFACLWKYVGMGQYL
jgi:hypothetical protein